MRLVLLILTLGLPSIAWADLYPYVQDGPVITGATSDEAWVAWYTAHDQGAASGVNLCRVDADTGTPNDTIPTLTLSPPAAGGAAFSDPTCSRYHRVHLTGLNPATAYTFTLDKTQQAGTTARGRFQTAPAVGESPPFRFVIYGDNRDNPLDVASTRPQHEALIAAILANDPDVSFVINVGDYALNLVTVSGDDRGYTEFFDVERQLLATRPIFAAFGNHESMEATFYDALLRSPMAEASHPYYYSFDWGSVHVALLDSFEGSSDPIKDGERSAMVSDLQAQWLDSDLASAQQAGKLPFVISHQGAYAYSTSLKVHGGLPDVQNKVVPLMLKYGALAIAAGHDHMYERGHEGCIDYFVVGAGGAETIDPDLHAPGVAAGTSATSYLVITVAGSTASAEAKDTNGNVVDRLDLKPASCAPSADAGTPADVGAASDGQLATTVDATTDAANAAEASDAAAALDAALADGSSARAASPSGCGCSAAHGPWLALGAALSSLLRRNRPR